MTKQSKAELALLGTTLIWASTFVGMKIALRDFSPVFMTGLRFSVASFIFLALFWKIIFPLSSAALKMGSLLGLILFVGFIAQNIGLQYTTVSKSAFITSLMVVFVPFFQFLVERRSPTRGNVLGILVIVCGLWLLTSPAGSAFNVGDLLTLICALFFGYYIVYLDIASKAMTTVQLAFLQSTVAAILGMVFAFGFEDIRFNPTTNALIAIGYLTIFATVITTLIQTAVQKFSTPTRAAIIFTIEPVWASIYAYFIIGETLEGEGIVGGALIVAGVLLSELSGSIPFLNQPVLASVPARQ